MPIRRDHPAYLPAGLFDAWQDHPLSMALDMSVSLLLLEMARRDPPGPTAWERERATGAVTAIVERGDVLLFGHGKPGVAAGVMADLTVVLAVLAHQPGGVRAFGTRWEAMTDDR